MAIITPANTHFNSGQLAELQRLVPQIMWDTQSMLALTPFLKGQTPVPVSINQTALQQQINAAVAAAVAQLPPATVASLDSSKVTGLSANRNLAVWAAAVDTFIQNATAGSGSIPTVVAPTISGTTVVGQLLTGAAGAVTTVGGHASSSTYQWNRENATTARTPIANAIALTYTSSASDLGFQLSLTQIPKDTVTGAVGNPATSLLTALITGVAPTNSVAPSFSLSGAQPATATPVLNLGTWAITGGGNSVASVAYQIYDNAVPIGGRVTVPIATTSVPVSLTGREGHTITADVYAISNLGVRSVGNTAASNSITVSGTAVIVEAVGVTLQGAVGGNVTQNIAYPIVPAQWNKVVGGVTTPITPDSRSWVFYKNGVVFSPSNGATSATYDPANFPAAATTFTIELAMFAGDPNPHSTNPANAQNYTVNAPSATLALTLNQGTYSFAADGVAENPFSPANASGGTGTLLWSVTPAPSAQGFALNSSSGVFTGNATGTSGSVTYTLTVQDSTGATASVNFSLQVTNSSGNGSGGTITPLAWFNAGVPNAQQPANQIQVLGNYPLQNTIPDAGIQGATNLTIFPGFTTKTRWGKITDPVNSGRQVYLNAVSASDPQTAGSFRCDYSLANGGIAKNTPYWCAFEVFIPSNMINSGDDQEFTAIHEGPDTGSGNWALEINTGTWVLVITTDNFQNGYNLNPQPSADAWHKFTVDFMLSTASNGYVKMYCDGVLVWSYSGPTTVAAGGDYAKCGVYPYLMTAGFRFDLWRSYYIFPGNDANGNHYTQAQIAAQLV